MVRVSYTDGHDFLYPGSLEGWHQALRHARMCGEFIEAVRIGGEPLLINPDAIVAIEGEKETVNHSLSDHMIENLPEKAGGYRRPEPWGPYSRTDTGETIITRGFSEWEIFMDAAGGSDD